MVDYKQDSLLTILPNVILTNVQPTYEHMGIFQHLDNDILDYVWGENTYQTVYPLVVKLIENQATQTE